MAGATQQNLNLNVIFCSPHFNSNIQLQWPKDETVFTDDHAICSKCQRQGALIQFLENPANNPNCVAGCFEYYSCHQKSVTIVDTQGARKKLFKALCI